MSIVLDTDGSDFREDGWRGGQLALGTDVVLRLGSGLPRCVMIDQPQADVTAGPPLLRTLGRAHGLLFGVQADVVRTGLTSIGDTARLTLRPWPEVRLRLLVAPVALAGGLS